ncbi:MAG: MotA/TolQ/ExbB proton channel family protein [Spirochaetes bacterium]|nr:MotA/TolQ/ExbB proton channel family protein [Spirochaetota bacterium]
MLSDTLVYKGGVIMIPIILGSIIALAIVINRINYFLSIKMDVNSFIEKIYLLLKNNDINKAIDECSKTKHPIGKVFNAGLENINKEHTSIEKAMERAGILAIADAEKYMLFLVIIIGIEPMLGFLGTIIGLINSFIAWEKAAASVTVDFLAGGIYQAMITTASGLIVAIPYYIIYHIMLGKIDSMTKELNLYGEELLETIKDVHEVKK